MSMELPATQEGIPPPPVDAGCPASAPLSFVTTCEEQMKICSYDEVCCGERCVPTIRSQCQVRDGELVWVSVIYQDLARAKGTPCRRLRALDRQSAAESEASETSGRGR